MVVAPLMSLLLLKLMLLKNEAKKTRVETPKIKIIAILFETWPNIIFFFLALFLSIAIYR